MESGHQDFSEDQPIISRGAYEMFSEMLEDNNETEETGELSERIESKNWKTRSKAYQEILEDLQNSHSFYVYSSKLHKFLSDPNPNPQEKAMEILNLYIKTDSSSLTPYCDLITKPLIEKHISGSRVNIKDQAKELLLGVYRIDKEKVLLEILKYFDHKNLKFQVASISGVNYLIKNLGVKDFNFKAVIPYMEKAAETTNISIRSEALNFYKELYKIINKGIEPYLSKLKKQQQDELNKAFAAMTIEEVSESNMYDLLDSCDIFTYYNEKWADSLLAMEKWSEKKDALEELNAKASFPKLAEKNPAALVGLAKRLMKDNNVNVAVQAIRLVGNLAKGQKKFFEPYAKAFMPIFLSKFNDKKPQIIQELHKSLDLLTYSVKVDCVLNHIQAALQDKSVATKLNTMQWLEKTGLFHIISDDVAKDIFITIKGLTDDSNESVRESCFSLLKALVSKYSYLSGLLSDLSQAKLKKLETTKPLHITTPSKVNLEMLYDTNNTKIMEKYNNRNAISEKNNNPGVIDNNDGYIDIIPANILANINEKSWKSKQTGLQDLKDFITSSTSPQDLLKIHNFITKSLNNFKENNPNIIKSGLECIKKIYSLTLIPEDYANSMLVSNALDKLSENKVNELYKDCIISLCEIVTPDYVTKAIIKNTEDSTKPKTLSESLELLGKIIKEFGPTYLNLRAIAEYGKNALSHTNPIIKKSAVSLLAVIHFFQDSQLIEFLNGLKENVISTLKEEFKKSNLDVPSQFRKIKCKASAVQSGELIKKINIAALVTPQLLKDLSDTNWKTRKESLDKIESIISKKIAPAGLAELFRQLKLRLSDPNKSIIKTALAVLGKLSDSLGNDCAGYCRLIIPSILSNFADKQLSLRQEVKLSLDKWAFNAGAENIISLVGPQLCQDNPELRLDILSWVLANKDCIPKSDIKALLPGVIACLQDRVASIRNQAEFLFGEIVEFTGFDTVSPFLKDIKPAFLQSLQIIFDKYSSSEAKSIKNKPGVKRIPSKIGKNLEFRVLNKDKRGKSEGLKWIYEEMRPDQLENIKNDLKSCTSEELHSLLFHNDFKRKLYACDVIKSMLANENIYECWDLIFKWCFLEIGCANTQIVKTVLELQLYIVQYIREKSYILTDLEAEILIPSLCEKISFNNGFYRGLVSKILREICLCYPGEKFYSLIICGLNSKSCGKSECLQELLELYIEYKSIISPKDIKNLAKYLKSPDNNTRGVVLKILSEVYKVIGKKIWEYIGPTTDKTQEMLCQAFSCYKDTELLRKSFMVPDSEDSSKKILDVIIEKLSFGDLDAKINSLNTLNSEVLGNLKAHEDEISRLKPDLIETMCKVSRFAFSSFKEVPKKFIIYFLNVINFMFESTSVLKDIDKVLIESLYEEFIARAGEVENDAEIQVSLSSTLLSLLEFSDINVSLIALISLLSKHKDCPRKLQVNIKCVLKLSKCLSYFKILSDQIILAMHKHLVQATQTEDYGVRVIKTLLQELVFLLGPEIWSSYSIVSLDPTRDVYISSWINDILIKKYPIVLIFKKLNNDLYYSEGITELSKYIKDHPEEDIKFLMKRYPELSARIEKDLSILYESKTSFSRTSSMEELELKFNSIAKQRQNINSQVSSFSKSNSLVWSNYK